MTQPAVPADAAPRLLVLGEALIDVVRDVDGGVEEHVGGSPLNVALGLSRLGHPVDFATTIGQDARGERITALLDEGDVTLTQGSRTADPTSTAQAQLDATGAATYVFDLHFDLPPVPLAPGTGHAHTGSIGALLTPGEQNVRAALDEVRAHGTVSYDPNIRPSIMGSADEIRPRIEAIIALSDVVKASSDDLDYLYPGDTAAAVMAHWCTLGAGLAVITLGAHGVIYRTAASEDTAAAPTAAAHVVDTVGAGDSFMAGLVSGLLDLGYLGHPDARTRLAGATLEEVRPAIERGLATSAVTVGRAGAYAPTRAEITA